VIADAALGRLQLVQSPPPPPSAKRFPDGASFRVEIPSVEGARVLEEVVRAAEGHEIVVNRVSQGSGAMLLSDVELREMAAIGADAGLEVSLFVGPREEWGITAMARADAGGAVGANIRGLRQLRYAVEDVLRAVDGGIRSFLVADIGLLRLLHRAQVAGDIPADVVWKVSVMIAPSNPATVGVLEDLGASTINLPTDLTLAELAEMRAGCSLPLDLYLEAPDPLGGVVRAEQLHDIVSVSAPLYAKFGLRNSRLLYPSGLHIEADAIAIAREKVHRVQVALDWAARCGEPLVQSGPGAPGLGVPQVR